MATQGCTSFSLNLATLIRSEDGAWLLREYRPGDFFTLGSIGLPCAVNDDVDFSEAAQAATP